MTLTTLLLIAVAVPLIAIVALVLLTRFAESVRVRPAARRAIGVAGAVVYALLAVVRYHEGRPWWPVTFGVALWLAYAALSGSRRHSA